MKDQFGHDFQIIPLFQSAYLFDLYLSLNNNPFDQDSVGMKKEIELKNKIRFVDFKKRKKTKN